MVQTGAGSVGYSDSMFHSTNPASTSKERSSQEPP
jgi:hypothetical protein